MHLGTVDIIAGVTAHRNSHLLHQRVIDNGVVLVNDGQVHDVGVGKALEIGIHPFYRITKHYRREGVVGAVEGLDNQTVDAFDVVGNIAFRRQLRRLAVSIDGIYAKTVERVFLSSDHIGEIVASPFLVLDVLNGIHSVRNEDRGTANHLNLIRVVEVRRITQNDFVLLHLIGEIGLHANHTLSFFDIDDVVFRTCCRSKQ